MRSYLFDKKLNEFCRKYYIAGNEHLVRPFDNYALELQNLISEFCEQILYHDGVSISIYGENIVIPLLIKIFGIKGFEELLEQKAIKFILDSSNLGYMTSDTKGISPLQSGVMTSPAHSDPAKSVSLGFDFPIIDLPRTTKRNLTRKILKNYSTIPKEISENAALFGHQGYENNIFEELGLPKTTPLTELNLESRKRLFDLACQCQELALLSHFKLNTINSYEIQNLTNKEIERIKNVKNIKFATDEVFRIQKIPAFSEMIKKRIINIKDIPKIRNSNDSIKFRNWILSSFGDRDIDSTEVSREYIEAISNSKNIFEKSSGKLARTITITGVSMALGTALAGGVGAISGAALGPSLDLGISLLDSFVIDGFVKGWNPKHFFDKEIKKNVLNKK